jgi:hypothetical protein
MGSEYRRLHIFAADVRIFDGWNGSSLKDCRLVWK